MYLAAYLVVGLLLYLGSDRAWREKKSSNLPVVAMIWIVVGWPVAVLGAAWKMYHERSGKTDREE